MDVVSQIALPGVDVLRGIEPGIAVVFVVTISCLLAALSMVLLRMHGRFVRGWESVDKRLSEVLWRTRHSDPEALRQRTELLEQNLMDMLDYLRTVANAVDTQLETLRTEVKTSLSRIDRADSKTLGQSRMIIYQLERIRSQLQPSDGNPPAGGSLPEAKPLEVGGRLCGVPDRMGPVVEPLKDGMQRAEKRTEAFEHLLKELSWD